MALSAPVVLGSKVETYVGAADSIIPAFTPSADTLLLLFHQGGGAPTSITGHGTWVQIGTTITITTLNNSLWGCISSGAPSSSIVTIVGGNNYATSVCVEVGGADVSGTVANAIVQQKTSTGYDSTPEVLTFDTLPTQLTMGWMAKKGSVSTITVGGTTIFADAATVGTNSTGLGYDDPSSATISSTLTAGAKNFAFRGLEIKAATATLSLAAPDTVTHGTATTATGDALNTVTTMNIKLDDDSVTLAQSPTLGGATLPFTPDIGQPTVAGGATAVSALPETGTGVTLSSGTTAYQNVLEVSDV